VRNRERIGLAIVERREERGEEERRKRRLTGWTH